MQVLNARVRVRRQQPRARGLVPGCTAVPRHPLPLLERGARSASWRHGREQMEGLAAVGREQPHQLASRALDEDVVGGVVVHGCAHTFRPEPNVGLDVVLWRGHGQGLQVGPCDHESQTQRTIKLSAMCVVGHPKRATCRRMNGWAKLNNKAPVV